MKSIATFLLIAIGLSSAFADSLPNDRYGTRAAAYNALGVCLKDFMQLKNKYYPPSEMGGGMMIPPKGKGAKNSQPQPPQPQSAAKTNPFKEHPDLLIARNKAHSCTEPVLEWFFYYGWSKAFHSPEFDADHQDFNQMGYYPTDIFAAMTQRLGLATAWPTNDRDVSDAAKFCATQTVTYLVRAECYQPLVDWYVAKAQTTRDQKAQKQAIDQAVRLSTPLVKAFHDAINENDKRPQGNFKERMFKYSRYSEALEWLHATETGSKIVPQEDSSNPHILVQSLMEKAIQCAPDDLSVIDTLTNLIDAEISNKNAGKADEPYLNSKTVMRMIAKYRPLVTEPFDLNDAMLPQVTHYVKNTPFKSEAEKRDFMKTFKAMVDAGTQAFPARILQIEKYAKAYDKRAGLMTAPNTLNSDQLDGFIETLRRKKDPKYIAWVLESLTQRVHMYDQSKITVEFFSQTDAKGNLVYMGRPDGKPNRFQLDNHLPRPKFITTTLDARTRQELHLTEATPGAVVIRNFQDLANWSKKTAEEISDRPIRSH